MRSFVSNSSSLVEGFNLMASSPNEVSGPWNDMVLL